MAEVTEHDNKGIVQSTTPKELEQMSENKITPVLLCGGSGTRLWPLSRKSYPKQFAKLLSDKTMLQETALRVTGDGFDDPIIVTSEPFRFIVVEQLEEIGIRPQAVLLEPEAKNTAPAVLSAVTWVNQNLGDRTLAVMPTDHSIPNSAAFSDTLKVAANCSAEDKLVTLGIKPTHPATGYGYIEPKDDLSKNGTPVTRFIEKPDLEKAERLIADPNMLWNAGIFVFASNTAKRAFESHAADLVEPVKNAVTSAEPDFGFLRLDALAWSTCPSISIDYAIMERANNVCVVPFDAGWSDLGSWDAIWSESDPDADGCVAEGDTTTIDCQNSLLRGDDDIALIGIGLKDIVVVAEQDAVLVADRNRSNDVGSALKLLREKQSPQADQARRDFRPWGWFESLTIADKFQVKRICVKPGGTLSLQSHQHRAEHWVVVEGTAEVTIGNDVQLVGENQSVYVPLGTIHRMKNPTDEPMTLIEIQTGTYFGEDDIKRYDDVYARGDDE